MESSKSIKWYMPDKPCKNGHLEKRYINTDICYECKRQQNKRDYKKHKDRVLVGNRRSYQKRKDKHYEYSKLWQSKNRAKSNQIKKAYKIRHREKYLASCRDYMRNKRSKDPLWKLSRNMSKAIWEYLKNNKNFRRWNTFVDYSLDELRMHLEGQFDSNMSWSNYGSYWEIDHIIPLAYYKGRIDLFSECWALKNLRPLECSKNRSKGARLDYEVR